MVTLEKTKKAAKLRPIKLTDRDDSIFRWIWLFDGVMSAEQIQRLEFGSWHRARLRLGYLYQHGYLNRPDRHTRAGLPQMIYWLTAKSAERVAGSQGRPLKGFKWRHKPRWGLVPHDLKINDFRVAVYLACRRASHLQVLEWTNSGQFWRFPDTVTYRRPEGNEAKRTVRPDGFFVIHNQETGINSRFLLELDNDSNEDLSRIADEKILPGIWYFASEGYKRRTGGFTSGHWLFVISTPNAELRLANMKRKVESVAGKYAKRFWFTTLDAVLATENALLDPIWYEGGNTQLLSLIFAGDDVV